MLGCELVPVLSRSGRQYSVKLNPVTELRKAISEPECLCMDYSIAGILVRGKLKYRIPYVCSATSNGNPREQRRRPVPKSPRLP